MGVVLVVVVVVVVVGGVVVVVVVVVGRCCWCWWCSSAVVVDGVGTLVAIGVVVADVVCIVLNDANSNAATPKGLGEKNNSNSTTDVPLSLHRRAELFFLYLWLPCCC